MKKLILVIMSSLLLTIMSCSNEEIESKSMEQIYKEEGVPVKIQKIAISTFEKSLNYSGILTGITQSSAHAAFGDEVEKVHVKVGDYVKKDQLLVSFPTDAPSAQYNQAKVAFESIEKTYKRMQTLLEKGAISQQDFDNVETQYEVTNANWDLVRKMVKVLAPISGYVTKVNVNETDNVRGEAELIVISNTEKLKSRIFVTEKDYPKLKKSQVVKACWNGNIVTGEIVQIDRTKDMMKQGFGVMVQFDNPGYRLPSGITAELDIIIESNPNAIVLDKKYITTEGQKNFVFTENKGKSSKKEVIIGNRNELKYEILDGVNRGENLIIEGHKMVKNNQKVKVLNRG